MKEQFEKIPYEDAKLEITHIDSIDVITTSDTTMGWEDNVDDNGWT